MSKINLKKNDKVIVLTGRDKGKTGIVDKVSLKTASVLVEGLNIVKKHVKVSKKYPQGGVVEVVKPISVSKVQLVCPNCGKPTRIAYDTTGKEKMRVCKKCKKTIITGKRTDEPKKATAKPKGGK